jgi:hypothetical protein
MALKVRVLPVGGLAMRMYLAHFSVPAVAAGTNTSVNLVWPTSEPWFNDGLLTNTQYQIAGVIIPGAAPMYGLHIQGGSFWETVPEGEHRMNIQVWNSAEIVAPISVYALLFVIPTYRLGEQIEEDVT